MPAIAHRPESRASATPPAWCLPPPRHQHERNEARLDAIVADLDAGADPEQDGPHGRAIHVVLDLFSVTTETNSGLGVLRRLIASGVDVDSKDGRGIAPIDEAGDAPAGVTDARLVAIRALLDAGAQPDGHAKNGTPLAKILVHTTECPRPYSWDPGWSNSAVATLALLRAGAAPVTREAFEGMWTRDGNQHNVKLVAAICAAHDAVAPDDVRWRWGVQSSFLTGKPFRSTVPRAPGWRSIGTLVGMPPRPIGPTKDDVAWATLWATSHADHPRSLELMAACGGADR